MGKVKPQRVRCQLVLDVRVRQLFSSSAVERQLVYCKNPAKHRLRDGTWLCTVHWRMSGEDKRKVADASPDTATGDVLDRRKDADQ